MGIFLISHKLDEVLRVSDRFTVLRRGRLVATLPRADVDRSRLATLIIGELSGRTLDASRSATEISGEVRLEARDLSIASDLRWVGGRGCLPSRCAVARSSASRGSRAPDRSS